MKNIILPAIVSFVLLFAPIVSGASTDGIREIVLQTETPSGTSFRSPSAPELECYLIEYSGTLLLSSSLIISNVEITIVNISTGDYYYSTITLSPVPSLLSLNDSGDYTINVYLPGGLEYSGYFSY